MTTVFSGTMVFLCATLGLAQDAKKPATPDDLKALQGLWTSGPDANVKARLMFLDGKIGWQLNDAKTDRSLFFLGLTKAEYGESKGKRYFTMPVSKDTAYKVFINKIDKDHLTVEIGDRGEFALTRLSVRASTNVEAKKLLGTWTITAAEVRGQKATPKQLGLEEIVFTEDRYSLKAGGKELLGSFYRVDAKAKPTVMDWFGVKADFVIPLIYELDGDELRVCHPVLGKEGSPRPSSFDTKGTQTVMIRAKRAK